MSERTLNRLVVVASALGYLALLIAPRHTLPWWVGLALSAFGLGFMGRATWMEIP